MTRFEKFSTLLIFLAAILLVAGTFSAYPEKTTPVGADTTLIYNSATSKTNSSSLSNLTKGLDASNFVTGTLPYARGGTGASLVDPNADRILFWDDSTGAVTHLTAGTGLTITGTTITSSATPAGADTEVQFNDGGLAGGDSGHRYNKTNNRLGIGVFGDTTVLDVQSTTTTDDVLIHALGTFTTGGNGNSGIGIEVDRNITPVTSNNATHYAVFADVDSGSANMTGGLEAGSFSATLAKQSGSAQAIGVRGESNNNDVGSATLYGGLFSANCSAGTVTNAYGVQARSSGTVTNSFAVNLVANASATHDWGVYSGNAKNYFSGSVEAGPVSTTNTGANYLTIKSSGANTLDRGIQFNNQADAVAGYITMTPNTVGTDSAMKFYVGGSAAGDVKMTIGDDDTVTTPGSISATGPVSAGLGSFANFTFAGDSDTGIARPAVNEVSIMTGGQKTANWYAGQLDLLRGSTDASPFTVLAKKSRGTVLSPTVIVTGDDLWRNSAYGYVGATSTYVEAARFTADTVGTISDTTTGISARWLWMTRDTGGTMTERFAIEGTGALTAPSTITAVGTTGNQTINKPIGRVNIAAAGTTVTVTNSLVTANSIVMAVASTNDSTARVTSVVPAAGSFVINTVAVTAETSFNFWVVGQ